MLQGKALRVTNITNLFLSLRRGFEPLAKPPANRWRKDVTDSGQRPPFIRFWYRSQSLCPYGASDEFYVALCATII